VMKVKLVDAAFAADVVDLCHNQSEKDLHLGLKVGRTREALIMSKIGKNFVFHPDQTVDLDSSGIVTAIDVKGKVWRMRFSMREPMTPERYKIARATNKLTA
jgi:hypothetical protein